MHRDDTKTTRRLMYDGDVYVNLQDLSVMLEDNSIYYTNSQCLGASAVVEELLEGLQAYYPDEAMVG